MAQTIKIKRSTTAATPSSNLSAGELAYSFNSDKLFIGDGSGNDTIGGKVYVDMLDHTAGTLTASSAIIVDSSSKIDSLKTANLTIGANSITAASGDVDIVAAANLDLDLTGGTIDVTSQATEIDIIDNSSTAFVITDFTSPLAISRSSTPLHVDSSTISFNAKEFSIKSISFLRALS